MAHATLDEIHDQPSALDAMLTAVREMESELDAVARPSTRFCLVGCGTSYYLSQVGSTLLDQVASAEAVPGGEVLLSPDTAPDHVDVIVPVSRSGESTETVRATDALRDRHPEATVLGVTCTEESPIDKRADLSVVSPEGAEDSVVMTKSFSSMLLAFEYLTALVEGEQSPAEWLHSVADDSATAVHRAEEVVRPLALDTDYETFFFLGTGEYYGLALEGMLKLEEMTLSWTKAYHPLEFRHGPQSIADDGALVMMFLPEREYDLHADLVTDARELGATVLVVGSEAAVDAVEADHSVVLPDRDIGRLPLCAPAFQLLGYYRAVALELNPDDPQNLSQVVRF